MAVTPGQKEASTFPQTPEFSGPLAPSGVEGDFEDLQVEGQIPPELCGSFIRVQPDPLFPPMLGDDVFFNGDGVVSSFRFNQGKVSLVQRFVETARVQAQRAAGKSLFGKYRNPYTNAEGYQDRVYSTANTNIVRYRDKLLALKEDSLPYTMDPVTLETLGREDMDGQFTAQTFTAHPKVCPDTNNFLAFSYRSKGEASTDMAFYEFDAKTGEKRHESWFKAPFPPFVHDFGFTENYLVFPVIPIKYNPEIGKQGGMILHWDYEQEILFGLMRRDGDGSDVRWLRLPQGFPGHVVNVFEEDGKVHIDLPIASDNVFYFFPDVNGREPDLQNMQVQLWRITLDPNGSSDQASSRVLLDKPMEFGRIDERFAGKPYQYTYCNGLDFSLWDFPKMGPPHPFMFNLIHKIDVHSGTDEAWCPGPTDSVQEPTFIPRQDQRDEADGYVVTVVNRLASDSSDLVVLDGRDITAGPVATIRCPMRMRLGLHGNWVEGLD